MRNEAAQDRLNHREKQRYLGCTRIVQSPLTLTETRKRYSCQLRNLDSPRSKCEIYLLIYLEADDDDLSGCMVNLIIRRWRITRVTDQGDDRARYTLLREFQRYRLCLFQHFLLGLRKNTTPTDSVQHFSSN